MNYVDGYVVPVPKKKVQDYRRLAQKAAKVWREHGALDYVEAVAEDVKRGEVTSFPRSVKQKPNETVVFAYVVFKSRAHRDQVNKKVMSDPRLKDMCDINNLPFDAKRMFWGGFKVLVSTSR